MLDNALKERGLEPDLMTRRRMIAALGLKLVQRLPGMGLPGSVLELYPRAYAMLCASLREDVATYDADYYAKDVRFVLGLSVPAGAQIVDLHSSVGPKVVLRQIGQAGGVEAATRYVLTGSFRPVLQIHTDTRDTADFNEEGWDRCYARVADLLERDPGKAGMVGTSWFYDPALLAISPRLAYLQKPFDHGAYRIRIGSSPLDAARAATKSPTRKALIDEGKYVPTSFSLVWPRRALIAWARSYRA